MNNKCKPLCVHVHYGFLSGSYAAGILGLEQFELGHSNGGSQDYSRIVYGMVSMGVVFDFKVFKQDIGAVLLILF